MRQALGKGIDALISSVNKNEAKKETFQKISVNKIKPNNYQPRQVFNDESLEELAQSIKKHGLTQPIVVYRVDDGSYELIAGERRLRASKLAGIGQITIKCILQCCFLNRLRGLLLPLFFPPKNLH